MSAQFQRTIRLSGLDALTEFFENVELQNIVAFIKDTNFYHCI